MPIDGGDFNEAFAGKGRFVQIAKRQALAQRHQFAFDAGTNGLQVIVHHGDGRSRDGNTDGNSSFGVGKSDRNAEASRKSGVLRRTISVDQLRAPEYCQCLAHVRHGQGLAPDQKLLERRQAARILIDHAVEQRRGQPRGIDPRVANDLLEAGRGGQLMVGIEDTLSAVQ